MSFIAIHRTTHTSLATDQPGLDSSEWSACVSATQLLDRLQQLHDAQSQRLEEAAAEAWRAGHAAGHDEALQTTATALLAAWNHAADTARTETRALRQAVVALSVQVVQRITTKLAPPEVVAALIERASDDLMPEQAAVVRVHPDVVAAVQGRLVDSPLLEVRADPTLAPLDCVFDTPTGQLLAGLQTQLDRVTRSLHAGGRSDRP